MIHSLFQKHSLKDEDVTHPDGEWWLSDEEKALSVEEVSLWIADVEEETTL